ncbi:MAG: 26S proteasome subunit RPN7-domain-containing protein [Piptocephalis tieghemiana]|nr:MAG: 26S proteasome subunit RPN7-domain-containing protein [Piptocephalis tieghemiana]
MAPFYKSICIEQGWTCDEALLDRMVQQNKEELEKLDERLQDAEENLGESEVADALRVRAEHFARIGDKETAITAYRTAFDKTAPVGHRLDLLFALLRIGLFFSDDPFTVSVLSQTRDLVELGGDWDRRNRLKVYEAIRMLRVRDFSGASKRLLETLSTFTSTELLPYRDFILYVVISSLLSLDRVGIKEKVLEAPEVLEMLPEISGLSSYLVSLDECDYSKFFRALAEVDELHMATSMDLQAHRRYYAREMRIKAYAQLLESYQSLGVSRMAEAFGVSEEFIDRDVSRFIAAGRLHCMIDKVAGVVVTNRPDTKNAQYQACVKNGDSLLSRVQKLSRVINV